MRTMPFTLMLLPLLLPRIALAAPASPMMMTAFLDKSVYRVGQPIVLEVDLHNPRIQRVSVGNGAYQEYWFQFTLLDAAGRLVPRTARGKEMLKPAPKVSINPPVVFGPKATHRYRINLAALFLVSRANSYTLRVSSTPSSPVSPMTVRFFKFRLADAAENVP